MKINPIKLFSILTLVVALLLLTAAIALQFGMNDITTATHQSTLSADKQTELISNFESIKSLSFIGGIIFAITGAVAFAFRNVKPLPPEEEKQ